MSVIDPEPRRILGLLIGLPALIAFSFLAQWLLGLGGTPDEQGTLTVYRIKPMMRLISWVTAAAGIGLCWQASGSWGNDRVAALIEFALAAICFVLAIMVPSQVLLDGEGIRYHRLLCRDAFVSWRDLSHVEKQKRHNSKTMTDSVVYFYRGISGASVPVDDMGFNAEDVLRRVREHHKCPEQPYKKRNWYGG